MRKKYKNELFEILMSSKYGIDSFRIKEEEVVNSLTSDIIEVKNTPFYFVIRNSNDDFDAFDYQCVRYAPGFPLSEIYPPQDFSDFDYIKTSFKSWINQTVTNYFEDMQEPDLWEEFINGNKTININEVDFNNQANFSVDEKKQIELSLMELKLLIQNNLKTTSAEQIVVNNRIDYLIEACERLNKFEWKSLAISSMISISIALSLDTQKGHLIFELFKKVFSIIPLLTK